MQIWPRAWRRELRPQPESEPLLATLPLVGVDCLSAKLGRKQGRVEYVGLLGTDGGRLGLTGRGPLACRRDCFPFPSLQSHS
jgi:hypothetical protein